MIQTRVRIDIVIFTLLILFAGFLRFYKLGYSDYINDEPGTFIFRGRPEMYPMSAVDFLLSRRKGPVEVFVGFVPRILIGNYKNELAQRIPFAFFNTASVAVCYLLIKKLTKNKFTAFIAAMLFSVNGFVVAFGRVAQYQSLNLFFSLLSLYFYSHLLDSQKKLIRTSLLGTLMFCISLLSHWDAVYILPAILFIFVKFLLSRKFGAKYKIRILLLNFVLGCLLLLPFLVPYSIKYLSLPKNQEYFVSRVGIKESADSGRDIFRFKLFNPFLAWEFYVVGTILGICVDLWNVFKKRAAFSGVFSLWFLFCFVVFKFFIPHAGTHIYNLTIPSLLLISLALGFLISLFPKWFKAIPLLPIIMLVLFFYYQDFLVFVDSKNEYPWEREVIFGHETRKYMHEDNIRHLIGFPKYRNWQAVNDFVTSENEKNNENLGYVSNEDKGISGFYMDADHNNQIPYYAIGVKKPLSFQNDYKFPQISDKHTVKRIEIDGETKVQVFRVDPSM